MILKIYQKKINVFEYNYQILLDSEKYLVI